MKEKKHITVKEVSQLLNTPLVTVLRWAYQGKIPCKLKKDAYSFKRDEIIKWANAHDMCLKTEIKNQSNALIKESVGLKETIARGGFIYNLEGNDIYSVLKNAVDQIQLPDGTDKELVFNELINREEIASTGIGKGVAIPHPRKPLNLSVKEPMIPVVFLKNPVDFNAVDGEDIFVLFLMFSPNTQLHLKLLSRLSLCLQRRGFLSLLKSKASSEDIIAEIGELERSFELHSEDNKL